MKQTAATMKSARRGSESSRLNTSLTAGERERQGQAAPISDQPHQSPKPFYRCLWPMKAEIGTARMTYRQSLLTLLFTFAAVGCVYVVALRLGG